MLGEVLYSAPGPLKSPTNIDFKSPVVGAPVLFFVSGSGWSNYKDQLLNVKVDLDGKHCTTMQVFTNEATSHVSFVCSIDLVTLDFGPHTLTLHPSDNMVTDSNDSFAVTMVY